MNRVHFKEFKKANYGQIFLLNADYGVFIYISSLCGMTALAKDQPFSQYRRSQTNKQGEKRTRRRLFIPLC